MDNLIYEDDPCSDPWDAGSLASWVFVLPGAVLFNALALIFFGFFGAGGPCKYQIFDGKIRIVFGRPFNVDIPFNKIETAIEGGIPDICSLRSKNYISCYHKNIVIIVKKKGMNINITPNDPDKFIENLHKALNEWRRINPD